MCIGVCCVLTLVDLPSLLIMPVQRIPRYRMLFDELLKLTLPSHPDHRNLSRCCAAVATLAHEVNEHVRSKENFVKLLEIKRKFPAARGPTIVEPRRVFVREGVLQKLCRKGPKKRMFFLFSDALLYGTISDVPGTVLYMKPT